MTERLATEQPGGAETKGTTPLTDGERLDGLLTLVTQKRERFQQLESLEWRVNFSTWGFLGGVAFLFKTAEKDVAINHYAMFAFGIILICFHLFSIYRFNLSAYHHRLWADYFRDQAKTVLGLPSDRMSPPCWNERLPNNYRQWIAVESGTTLLISVVVGILIW